MIFKTSKIFKLNSRYHLFRSLCSVKILKPPWKILFFGNDSFSLFSLKMLFKNYKDEKIIEKLEVVTSVKNPKKDMVRRFCAEKLLNCHNWPLKTTNVCDFDLGIIVSFGKLLPEHLISSFPLGILNIHASLLPRWRGAAPIIHAIANGDKTTGISIMKIKPHHFDVGDILLQKEVEISNGMTAIDLHNILGQLGAEALENVIFDLLNYLNNAKPQSNQHATYAPKVTPAMVQINWKTMTSEKILNLSRALYGFYNLTTYWNGTLIKLLEIEGCTNTKKFDNLNVRFVHFDKDNGKLIVKCCDGKCIAINRVKISGSKAMTAADFNNGYINKEDERSRRFLHT